MPSSRQRPMFVAPEAQDQDLKVSNFANSVAEGFDIPLFDQRDPYLPLSKGTLRRKWGASLALRTDMSGDQMLCILVHTICT